MTGISLWQTGFQKHLSFVALQMTGKLKVARCQGLNFTTLEE